MQHINDKVAKVFYLWIETGSMVCPTGIIADAAQLLYASWHKEN
jgi:hypothetical protein